LREISGLLEEMPAEEGYPAYLPSRISSFYERAGIVNLYGEEDKKKENYGSLTIIGSVSPPSGDFSEPVTSTTKRFVQAFWALDANLAYSKHYPAINWLNSYSKYPEFISDWWYERDVYWPEIDIDWYECRKRINNLLSQENELKNIVQLVGEENLPENQQFILFVSKIARNSFLIQNAFDSIDCFTGIKKLIGFVKLILLFYSEGNQLLNQGYLIEDLKELKVVNDILRIGRSVPNDDFKQIEGLRSRLIEEIESLKLLRGVFKKK
jgi:V/A-type H+-transporting ATPase subunit A